MAVYAAYRHALFALKLGQRLTPGKSEYLFTDLLDYAAVYENRNGPALQQLVSRYVQPLLDHDARKFTQLTETLLAADSCGYQMTLTGKALNIHRNTLYARMAGIQTLLGADLGEVSVRNAIHLALAAHVLSELEF